MVFAVSPYNSGYSHGCDDAKISDASKRYINQQGKGQIFHTDEFMQGYNDGYIACSSSSSGATSKSNDIRGSINNLQNNKSTASIDGFFWILLIITGIVIVWRRRKSRIRGIIAVVLFLTAFFTWVSSSLSDYGISNTTKKTTAVFLLLIALGVVLSIRRKELAAWKKRRGLRRQFSGPVREQILKIQKYKCANCGMSISPPLVNYDHIDGNHSNNAISNCQALCPNCHSLKTDDDRRDQ